MTTDWIALQHHEITTETDAEQIGEQFEAEIAALRDLIEKENTHFENGDIAGAIALLDEKAERGLIYARAADVIQKNMPALTRLCPDRIARCTSLHAEFLHVLRLNAKLIGISRSISESFLRGVAQDVGSKRQLKTYGKTGQAVTPSANTPTKAIIVSAVM